MATAVLATVLGDTLPRAATSRRRPRRTSGIRRHPGIRGAGRARQSRPVLGQLLSRIAYLEQRHQQLTYQNPDTGAIESWLAKSWEINDALTQFTFHLCDDVSFSDGTKFTADSVKEDFDLFGRGDKGLGIVLVTAYCLATPAPPYWIHRRCG
ncbi:ABC transporter substrate-binding protein [Nocardia sp. NPDC004711]